MSNEQNSTAEQQPEAVEGVVEQATEVETAVEGDLEALQQALAAAEAKANDNYELALRTKAEAENIRRRAEQDVEKARKFALDRFVDSLVPVVDSLEMGLQAATGDEEAVSKLREGTELTLKMFLDVLEKNGVQQIDPQGQPFNPQLHEAMSMQESTDFEANTVMAVFQPRSAMNIFA